MNPAVLAVRWWEKAVWLSWAVLLATSVFLVARIQPERLDRTVTLDQAIPERMGDWVSVPNSMMRIVNPQVAETIQQVYSDTLSRTYANSKTGRVLMLSMAYGNTQDHANQTHKPEVCYPAQGFAIDSVTRKNFLVDAVSIPVTTMHAQLGARSEFVSYWLTSGNKVIRGAVDQNLSRLRSALDGKVKAGLLVRISEIAPSEGDTFEVQRQFADALVMAVNPDYRPRLGFSVR